MGRYWTQIQANVRKAKSRGTGKWSSGSFISEEVLGINLELMAIGMKEKMMPAAVRAAASIVKDRAHKYLKVGRPQYPSSSKISGTRYKWSKDTAQKRGGYEGANSLPETKKNILIKVRRRDYGHNTYAVVGPRYDPRGGAFNQAHVIEKGTGNHYWWGVKAKSSLRARPFMEPAGKYSISAQVAAMKKKMQNYKSM